MSSGACPTSETMFGTRTRTARQTIEAEPDREPVSAQLARATPSGECHAATRGMTSMRGQGACDRRGARQPRRSRSRPAAGRAPSR